MFKFKGRDQKKITDRSNDKAIKVEIDRLLARLKELEPGTDEYLATLSRIEDLNRLLPKREKKAIDINTVMSVGATLLIAGAVFFEEQLKDKIIRSKLWGWIRPRI